MDFESSGVQRLLLPAFQWTAADPGNRTLPKGDKRVLVGC